MDRRDWIITLCLLLPFFITLPLYLMSRSEVHSLAQELELTQDSLFTAQFRLQKAIERDPALIAAATLEPGQPIGQQTLAVAAPTETAADVMTTDGSTPSESEASEEPAEPVVVNVEPVIPVAEPPTPEPAPRTTPVPAPRATTAPASGSDASPRPPSREPVAVRTPTRTTPAPAPPVEEEVVAPAPPPVTVAKLLSPTADMKEQRADLAPRGLKVSQPAFTLLRPADGGQQRLTFSLRLSDLPAELQGRKDVYVVLTDLATQEAPAGLDDLRANVNRGGITVPIYAALKKSFNLTAGQTLTFTREGHHLLGSGRYLLEVYTADGLLTNVLFRLDLPEMNGGGDTARR